MNIVLDRRYFSEKKQRQLEHYRGRDSAINDVFSLDRPFQGAYQGTYLSKFIHKLHPELPKKISIDYKNFRTFYVFPRDDVNKTITLAGIDTFTLPISREEFRFVLNGIFQDVGKTA